MYLSEEKAGGLQLGNPLAAKFPAGDVEPILPFPFTVTQFLALEAAWGPFGLIEQLSPNEADVIRHSMPPAYELVEAARCLILETTPKTSIVLTNRDRLTITEVKRLISNAAPREPVIEIYARVDANGVVDESAKIETRFNAQGNVYGPFLDADFPGLCARLGIVPSMRHRPLLTEYTGKGPSEDTMYTIGFDEFVRITRLYDLEVAIQSVPTASSPPETAPEYSAPPKAQARGLRTSDVCEAFSGIHWDKQGWFETLTKTRPDWAIKECRISSGRPGNESIESLWDPLMIAKCLVTGRTRWKGQIDVLDQAFRSVELLRPWARPWAELKMDNPLWGG